MPKAAVVVSGGVSGTNIITHNPTSTSDYYEAIKACWGDENSVVPVTEKLGERLPVEATIERRFTDAFGQPIAAEPFTLFHSKLLFGKESLVWDEKETDTSGNATSTWAVPKVTLHCETNDDIIRQTYRRIPYIPGKGQRLKATGILASATGSGILNEIGLHDGTDGVYFEQNGSTLNAVVSNNGTKNRDAQSSWNIDNLDGDGDAANPSGITLDVTKENIYVIDFQWLGVGSVWFGVVIDGTLHWCHRIDHANTTTAPYMQYPNLPVRYRCSTTSTTVEMQQVCAVVESIGGTQDLGQRFWVSTEGTHVDAATADTAYAVVGIKLKDAYTEAAARVAKASVVAETSDNFEWLLLKNPTVAGTFTYSDVSGHSVQRALGGSGNNITALGTLIDGGWASDAASVGDEVANSLAWLGTDIDAAHDAIVLAVRPGGSGTVNADINGGLTVEEIL